MQLYLELDMVRETCCTMTGYHCACREAPAVFQGCFFFFKGRDSQSDFYENVK